MENLQNFIFYHSEIIHNTINKLLSLKNSNLDKEYLQFHF